MVGTPKNLTKRQEEILREFDEVSKGREKEGDGWKRLFKAEN
jgi:DnaJ-class molecular chaperone